MDSNRGKSSGKETIAVNNLAGSLAGLYTSENVKNGCDAASVNSKVRFLQVQSQVGCIINFLSFSPQNAMVNLGADEYDLLVKKIKGLVELGNGETIFEVGAGEGW